MKKLTLFLIVSSSVVLFDAMAAIVSQSMRLEYSDFGIGSTIIYFLAGFFGSYRFTLLTGTSAAFIAGAVDSTLGLLVSQLIGPHTAFELDASLGTAFQIFLFVSIFSTAVGSVGALIGSLIRMYSGGVTT